MFSERIKEARKRAGLNQEQVGQAVGLSRQAISTYELGRSEPDLSILRKIATVLNTSVSYLTGETDDPNPPKIDDEEVIRSDMPVRPPGWERLSKGEQERLDRMTRSFEVTVIEEMLRGKNDSG